MISAFILRVLHILHYHIFVLLAVVFTFPECFKVSLDKKRSKAVFTVFEVDEQTFSVDFHCSVVS